MLTLYLYLQPNLELHLMAIHCAADEHGGLTKKTRKRGNCECNATWGRPTPRQSFLLLLRCHAKFEVAKPIHFRITAFLLLMHYFTMWTWPLIPWTWPITLTLNIYSVSPVTWWNSVPNLNAIEQSAAELLRFQCLTLWRTLR